MPVTVYERQREGAYSPKKKPFLYTFAVARVPVCTISEMKLLIRFQSPFAVARHRNTVVEQ